jgi:purine nucleosidase
VLFDTDIGSDIDDAVALAYLLAQPRCDLLGVTTVTGDTRRRAALVAALCDAAGRSDVPIHCGATGPLLHGPGQPHTPQYDAIADKPHRERFPDSHAVEFLRQTIRSRPGQITLIAVGPMTNIALLFASDPEIPGMLKQLVLMCGAFEASSVGLGPGRREWNAQCDPLATAMVFAARPPRLLSVGLNVTLQCPMPMADVRQRFGRIHEPFPTLLSFAEVWFQKMPHMVFHDPLACELVFEPDLCRYRSTTVHVESGPGPLAGITVPQGNDGPHELAVEVDADRVSDHYFQTVEDTFGLNN